MSTLQGRLKRSPPDTAVVVVGFTGAAPQQVNGVTQTNTGVAADCASLSAIVYCKATTNTLTLTVKWQVSSNGTTWYECYSQNNATLIDQVTGTGSAVTATRSISAPDAIYGMNYYRCVVVSGVGVGGGLGVDECSIQLAWRAISPMMA